MSSDNTILERIDRYTRGMMGQEELELFEQEIASNEQLQRKIELSMIVDQMVVAKEALKLKEQMRKDLYKSKPNWGTYLGIALAGITIGGVLWAYQHPQERKNDPVQVNLTKESVVKNETKGNEVTTPSSTTVTKAPQTTLTTTDQKTLEKAPSISAPIPNQVLVPKEDKKTLKEEHPTSPKTLVVADEKMATSPSPVLVSNPCASLQSDVAFSVIPSCKGEETGEVHVHLETVKGGKAPYTFRLGDQQSQMSFDKLMTGYYDLWIKDAQNCQVQSLQKVFVPEKNCKTPQQYVFNPDYDHSWVIPYDKAKKPTRLVIQEKGGKIFYQSSVNDFQPAEWVGDSNTGLALSLGLYFFNIEYTDGSVDEGAITITK